MKNKTFAFLLSLGLMFGVAVPSQAATADPSEVKIKLYEVWVSANADCSSPTRIMSDPDADYQDMLTGPTFGSGTIPNGTYPCVIWKMGDVIQYRPAANTVNCTAGTLYTRDLFRADDPQTSTCPDGTSINSSGSMASPINDQPCLHLSTGGTNDGIGWTSSSPFLLSSPFIVSGDRSGVAVTDFRGKIADSGGGDCDLEAPVFSFR